jgi:hypothetical protein
MKLREKSFFSTRQNEARGVAAVCIGQQKGLLHRVPWDLDIAIMRIVFSGVDYGSYHSELRFDALRFES